MKKIEEIYEMVYEKMNAEEIQEDWKVFTNMRTEANIKVDNDDIFEALSNYIDIYQRKGFIKGFQYAMGLMKECGI